MKISNSTINIVTKGRENARRKAGIVIRIWENDRKTSCQNCYEIRRRIGMKAWKNWEFITSPLISKDPIDSSVPNEEISVPQNSYLKC
jgi:hypothetical protein